MSKEGKELLQAIEERKTKHAMDLAHENPQAVTELFKTIDTDTLQEKQSPYFAALKHGNVDLVKYFLLITAQGHNANCYHYEEDNGLQSLEVLCNAVVAAIKLPKYDTFL